ncbi:DUF4407 domain-containing protein [Actinopolymorpha cephalotaxi]|uniref:MYXO-CTERM domain-containing protein n=1 Tax=Actinopolymorpha cephalotaxi TaxID=504797 RepID=A0ABX2SDS2_9ACTN|nr:DUF4407 domain-containing protein [Actinopolymorpha cephalotaxi]NYH86326.1 hypothetical protein [Actinopolymorpha cephalotaxi]
MSNRVRVALGWLGLVGLVPLLFLYVVSGLAVPWWAVVGFGLVWCLLLLAAVRSRRRRPLLTLAMPLLGLALWFAVLWLGDVFLHWTA